MPRRSELRCVAHGVLGSFVSRGNDHEGYWALGLLYRLALDASSLEFSLALVGDADDLQEPALCAALRAKYRDMLINRMRARSLPVSWIQAAHITVLFEHAASVGRALARLERPYVVRLTFTNDLGKHIVVERVGACWPHEPYREYCSGPA
jgi:hypothetical protein